jgi:hypothetical protein
MVHYLPDVRKTISPAHWEVAGLINMVMLTI